jgi:oligopeptide transport system permease protein
MTSYFIRRLLWLVPVLFFVAFLTFALMHAAPGGPWDRNLDARQVDKTTQETLNRRYGLELHLWHCSG